MFCIVIRIYIYTYVFYYMYCISFIIKFTELWVYRLQENSELIKHVIVWGTVAPHLGNLAKESLAKCQGQWSRPTNSWNWRNLVSIDPSFSLFQHPFIILLSNINFCTAAWACFLSMWNIWNIRLQESPSSSPSHYSRYARSRVRILRCLQHHEWCESGQASRVKWQPISHTLPVM